MKAIGRVPVSSVEPAMDILPDRGQVGCPGLRCRTGADVPKCNSSDQCPGRTPGGKPSGREVAGVIVRRTKSSGFQPTSWWFPVWGNKLGCTFVRSANEPASSRTCEFKRHSGTWHYIWEAILVGPAGHLQSVKSDYHLQKTLGLNDCYFCFKGNGST